MATGFAPTVTVATTLADAVSMTDTVPAPEFTT